jgi:hypothetical protein
MNLELELSKLFVLVGGRLRFLSARLRCQERDNVIRRYRYNPLVAETVSSVDDEQALASSFRSDARNTVQNMGRMLHQRTSMARNKVGHTVDKENEVSALVVRDRVERNL